jgi:hypothetical protein
MTSPNEQVPHRKPLSEISHLFLSSIRDKSSAGQTRPQRIPPNGSSRGPSYHTHHSVDLTPEEFAGVSEHPAPETPPRRVPFSAVLAPHLNGQQVERVRQYAAHLASSGVRVGLILVDASEFRLLCFEHNPELVSHPGEPDPRSIQRLDPRRMSEALTELHADVDRWLLCVPSPRGPEARSILKMLRHWTLLSTGDPDGVVSGYRTLKGLSEIARPRLTLAVLDAASTLHAEKVARKLNLVCLQFLGWELTGEPPVRAAESVAEHSVLWCRATNDKAQLAAAPQWQVLHDFIDAVQAGAGATSDFNESVDRDEQTLSESLLGSDHDEQLLETPGQQATDRSSIHPAKLSFSPRPGSEDSPSSDAADAERHSEAPAMSAGVRLSDSHNSDEVIDLPGSAESTEQLVAAVLGASNRWIGSPVKPPMLPSASVAVSRDRRLVLLAAAERGLRDLRAIAMSYRWLNENQHLVAMALPQFSIDSSAGVQLHLLVDHADINADVLQPLLQSGAVAVQSYRRLRWSGRSGLLLEAA